MPATFILIALNVAAYLAEIASGSGGLSGASGKLIVDFGLYGPFVAEGEWYRLLTSAFLHADLLHIGFNMVLLYFLGRLLEPAIGTIRFVFLYVASLFAGAFGALLISPDSLTIGASGAIFGVVGATFVIARARGAESIASSVGILLVLNLAFSFSSARISLGGHLGGLAGGLLCALVIVAGERGMLGRNRLPLELGAMVAIALVSIAAAISVA
jgi:membrane associated rhomboid family serine protease